MAIYHFAMRIITRSQGGNVVAAAGHQAGERLTDRRTGKVYDFSRKSHVVHAEILMPAGAPGWASDRALLWNAVERIEDLNSRYDTAQLARDVDMALPRELTRDERLVLVRAFVLAEFVARGMVVDFGIHEPVSEMDGQVQPHAHMLLTMREVTAEGFGRKVRAWGGRALFNEWREQWAEHVNAALERAGVAERVDHRSLKAQGLTREPMPKIGRAAWEMERRGLVTRRGARWREVKEWNARRTER